MNHIPLLLNSPMSGLHCRASSPRHGNVPQSHSLQNKGFLLPKVNVQGMQPKSMTYTTSYEYLRNEHISMAFIFSHNSHLLQVATPACTHGYSVPYIQSRAPQCFAQIISIAMLYTKTIYTVAAATAAFAAAAAIAPTPTNHSVAKQRN